MTETTTSKFTKLDYCHWKKCGSLLCCGIARAGETCYTIFGASRPEQFDDYICYLEVDNH